MTLTPATRAAGVNEFCNKPVFMSDLQAAVPIIAMTANAFEEDRQAALKAGMNGHLAKPIETDKLFALLSEIIRGQGEKS